LILLLAASVVPAQTVPVDSTASRTEQDPTGSGVELAWTDLRGQPIELGDRSRIVVISFWATWCQPCIEKWPDLIRVHDAFAPYGVEFIGAAADAPDRAQAVLAYTRRYGINFPIGLGATLDQMRSVGLRPALPATVVLDERGHPFARFPGAIDSKQLAATLARMLGVTVETKYGSR
jgi:thiol-disulfide isomerase/thioredoxin